MWWDVVESLVACSICPSGAVRSRCRCWSCCESHHDADPMAWASGYGIGGEPSIRDMAAPPSPYLSNTLLVIG